MENDCRRRTRTFTAGVSSPPLNNDRKFILSPNHLPKQPDGDDALTIPGSPIRRHFNMVSSPVIQRLHSKMFGQQGTTHSDDEIETRARSSSALGLIKREDSCEFKIPSLTPPHSPLTPKCQRARSVSNELGDLNVDLYKNVVSPLSDSDEEKFTFPRRKPLLSNSKSRSFDMDILCSSYEKLHYRELENVNDKTKSADSLGTIVCSFRHVAKEHRLEIKLVEVLLNYQPSMYVNQSQWTLNPILSVEIVKDSRSPDSKRHIASLFHKNHYQVLSDEQDCDLSLKHKTNDNYLVKMVLYDGDVKQKLLAIGAVHFNILDLVTPLEDGEKIVTKELSMYDKLYGVSDGVINITLQWNSHEQSFILKLNTIEYPKEMSHLKAIFMKVNVFIGHREYEDFCTEPLPGAKQVQTQQNFNINITPDKIRNMWILLQVFEKHLMGNIFLHRCVIGPYMKPTLKDNTVSCWEKMILHPGEQVTCKSELYH